MTPSNPLRKKIFWIGLPILLLLTLTACLGSKEQKPNSTDELRHIKLPMGYIPDPQYAPFYVAAEKGYFREAGFEVEFDYLFETDGVALVASGDLPFAIVSGEQVLLARAQGLPVVYVFEWFQQLPIAVVSRSSAGISTPADLKGRTIGLPALYGASYIGYVGLLSASDIEAVEVDSREIGFTQVESLHTGITEAVVGYANNEPLQLRALGEEISVMLVADYIDLVANGIITNEDLIARDPAAVAAFVRALALGLADTLDNPQEAFEISKGYVEGLEDNRFEVLQASLEMWRGQPLGHTEFDSWQATEQTLLKADLLDGPSSDLSAAFSNDFLPGSSE